VLDLLDRPVASFVKEDGEGGVARAQNPEFRHAFRPAAIARP